MLTRSLIIRKYLHRLPQVLTIARNSTAANLTPKLSPSEELRLAPHQEKQDQRAPFAKNLFVGKYDLEFAAFPVPQTTPRFKEFMEWLKPIEDYVNTLDLKAIDEKGQIPEEVINNLRQLDVFSAAVPQEYGGLGFNVSEYSKLVETLSAIPALGAYLVKKGTAIEYLVRNGTKNQKSEYLPKIARGELSPTICISEDESGTSDTSIDSIAQLSSCENYFHLNATKTCVFDAKRSNLFIVIAECSDTGHSFRPEDTMTAFLVDKSLPGIEISKPEETTGLRGLDLCTVTFNNVKIPRSNCMGDIGDAGKTFGELFGQGKQYIGAQCIGMTKRFLKHLVENLKSNKDFNAIKFKNQTVQDIIGRTSGAIYGMESMTYLTAGMADNFEEQDCALENCMTEVFCSEESLFCILQGLQLLGITSHLKSEVFNVLLRDAAALTSYDGSILSTKIFIAMTGLQHAGNETMGKRVKLRRNPWNNPRWILWRAIGYEKTPDLEIADNLHPSLSSSAKLMEYCIARLGEVLEHVAVVHGRTLFDKQTTHKRIADISCAIFVMSSVLARTSRSYSLGMKYAEKEVYMTQVYCYMLYQKIKNLAEQIEDTEWYNGDIILQDISDVTFEKDGYFMAHPLERNFD